MDFKAYFAKFRTVTLARHVFTLIKISKQINIEK